jgi:hypothetical protein
MDSHPLDPLLDILSVNRTAQDLSGSLKGLFGRLDLDCSGAINYQEAYRGLCRLHIFKATALNFTVEDWEGLYAGITTDTEQVSCEQFRLAILGLLKLYIMRRLHRTQLTGDRREETTLLALKYMVGEMNGGVEEEDGGGRTRGGREGGGCPCRGGGDGDGWSKFAAARRDYENASLEVMHSVETGVGVLVADKEKEMEAERRRKWDEEAWREELSSKMDLILMAMGVPWVARRQPGAGTEQEEGGHVEVDGHGGQADVVISTTQAGPEASGGTDEVFGLGMQVAAQSKRVVQVMDVLRNSPACDAGLKVGDVIEAVNNESIAEKRMEELSFVLQSGELVLLNIVRPSLRCMLQLQPTVFSPRRAATVVEDKDREQADPGAEGPRALELGGMGMRDVASHGTEAGSAARKAAVLPSPGWEARSRVAAGVKGGRETSMGADESVDGSGTAGVHVAGVGVQSGLRRKAGVVAAGLVNRDTDKGERGGGDRHTQSRGQGQIGTHMGVVGVDSPGLAAQMRGGMMGGGEGAVAVSGTPDKIIMRQRCVKMRDTQMQNQSIRESENQRGYRVTERWFLGRGDSLFGQMSSLHATRASAGHALSHVFAYVICTSLHVSLRCMHGYSVEILSPVQDVCTP